MLDSSRCKSKHIKPNENLFLLYNYYFSASSIQRFLNFALPQTFFFFFLRKRGVKVYHLNSGIYDSGRGKKSKKPQQKY